MKMSLRGVVENLEETPSSQLRAFWRDTPGAAETISAPLPSEAKALLPNANKADEAADSPPLRATTADALALSIADAIILLRNLDFLHGYLTAKGGGG